MANPPLITARRLCREEERTDAATRAGAAAVEHPTCALDPWRAGGIVYTEIATAPPIGRSPPSRAPLGPEYRPGNCQRQRYGTLTPPESLQRTGL